METINFNGVDFSSETPNSVINHMEDLAEEELIIVLDGSIRFPYETVLGYGDYKMEALERASYNVGVPTETLEKLDGYKIRKITA